MKYIFTFMFLLGFSFNSFSQLNEADLERREDSLRKLNRRMTISDLFWNSSHDGTTYIGVTNSLELKSYYVGGEFKLYESVYYSAISASVYGNFRAPVYHFDNTPDYNVVALGAHLTILGLEGGAYFNRNDKWFYLAPKIGFDYGSLSVSYSYNIPVTRTTYKGHFGHNISVKYHLYLSTFKYHRSRRKSYGY